MAKDPAFLFYSSDFLVGTYAMSNEQVGKYIRLMCLQHQQGHLSESIMMSVMGGVIDQEVACKFKIDENGCYYNERLDEEATKRRNYTESRRKNLKPPHMDKHMESHMEAHMDKHMENEDVIDNKGSKSSKDNKSTDHFPAFWSAYPKKVAKTTAQTAFKKLNPDAAMMETILKALEKQKKSIQWTKDNGQFIPNPSTWLNQKRWEDDIPEVVNGQPGSRVQGSDRAGSGTNGNRFAKLGDPI